MRPALIIFIKNPRPGQVKTRLAATVGTDKALAIYRALLKRIRQVTQRVQVTKYLYYSQHIDEGDEWSPVHFHKRLQSGADLGARMSNAMAEILSFHDSVVLIGSDVPGITSTILDRAFQALVDHDLVIGSTEDGGYYLIGMSRLQTSLFDGMVWSTETVFEETIRRAKYRGLSWHELPMLADIDFEEDWKKLGWELD